MIVTDVGGNAEAVVHAETGFVVPPRDPKAISDAIITLARDPEQRRHLGAAGRKRVEKEFSIEKCVKANVDLYEDMLDRAEPRKIAAVGSSPWKAQQFSVALRVSRMFNCHKRCEERRRKYPVMTCISSFFFSDKRGMDPALATEARWLGS